jgi:hypothetical protein
MLRHFPLTEKMKKKSWTFAIHYTETDNFQGTFFGTFFGLFSELNNSSELKSQNYSIQHFTPTHLAQLIT